MITAKRVTKKLLNKLGFDLIKHGERQHGNPLDFRNINFSSTLEAIYASTNGQEIILNVPIIDCRLFGGLAHKAIEKSDNPFIKATIALNKGCLSYIDELTNYYEHFRPQTIGEYLGISLQNKQYANLPASYFLMPWDNESPGKRHSELFRNEVAEGHQYGMVLNISDGCKFFGSVSEKKITLESIRLYETYNSIIQSRYKAFKGFKENAQAVILLRDSDIRFMICGGQHRVAVAAALQISQIPVELSPALIYDKRHLAHMPAVVNGYYTIEEAEKLFDRNFDCA